MADKTQAQAAKAKLEQQYAGIQFGLGKNGDDWAVEVRAVQMDTLTASLPTTIDGVKVLFRTTGNIKPLV